MGHHVPDQNSSRNRQSKEMVADLSSLMSINPKGYELIKNIRRIVSEFEQILNGVISK